MDGVNAAVQQRYQEARNAMWDEAKRRLGEREAERARQREEARQVHEGTLDELLRQGEQKKQSLQDEYDRKMQVKLDAARQEWRDALEEARKKRQAKEAEGPGPGAPGEGPEDLLARVRGSLSGLGDLLEQTAKKTIGVTGTFNAAALLGLQAGGVEDRIANATERTAKGVEDLRRDVRGNRATFA